MQKITPCLWFDNQAEEAVNFYISVFSLPVRQAGASFEGDRLIKLKSIYKGTHPKKGTHDWTQTHYGYVVSPEFVCLTFDCML